MALNAKTALCTHIKVNGIRCGSPAMRTEVFCYFHQRMIRGVRTPPKSRLHTMAMFENQESIQASLMEVTNAIVRNHIDLERARLVLRALAIAARYSNRVRFDYKEDEMVKEIPSYPAAPPSGPFGLAARQAAALATIGIPQHEETETERLDKSYAERYAEEVRRQDEEKARKPPSRARGAGNYRRRARRAG